MGTISHLHHELGEQLGLELASGLVFCLMWDQFPGWGPARLHRRLQVFLNRQMGLCTGSSFVNFFPGWSDWRSLSSASPSSIPKSLLSVQSFICQAGNTLEGQRMKIVVYFHSRSVSSLLAEDKPCKWLLPHQAPLYAPETAQWNFREVEGGEHYGLAEPFLL